MMESNWICWREENFTRGTHHAEFEPLDLKAQTSEDTKKSQKKIVHAIINQRSYIIEGHIMKKKKQSRRIFYYHLNKCPSTAVATQCDVLVLVDFICNQFDN